MTISNPSYIPLSELSRRATIDTTKLHKCPINLLLRSAKKNFDDGDLEYDKHNIQDAYVHYLKGCRIVCEVIITHNSFEQVKKAYKHLKSRMLDRLEILEDITLELKKQDVANHRDGVSEEAMAKLPFLGQVDFEPNI